jgi:hypothetical protein
VARRVIAQSSQVIQMMLVKMTSVEAGKLVLKPLTLNQFGSVGVT